MINNRDRIKIPVLLLALAISLALSSHAVAEDKIVKAAKANKADKANKIGVEEKLGQSLPLDIMLTDSNGTAVRLGDLIERPTVLSLVYYSCKSMCPMILAGEARVFDTIQMKPGQDYSLITVSFDELDTPETAAMAKKDYLNAMDNPTPEEHWRFLTGDAAAIKRLMDSVGMRVMRTDTGFSHVAVLVVLSAKGKIVRYIYGTNFLPFDIKMALTEAEAGRVVISARRALLYCFSYDPEGRRYVFNVIRVAGTVTASSAIIFFIYLVRSSKKHRKEMGMDIDDE